MRTAKEIFVSTRPKADIYTKERNDAAVHSKGRRGGRAVLSLHKTMIPFDRAKWNGEADLSSIPWGLLYGLRVTAITVLQFSANGNINDDYALFLSCTVGMFRE
jgi:hypothetical protein